MQNVLKPFGEKDTGSFDDQFRRAQFILTAVYVVILTFVLLLSLGVTRSVFFTRLDQRFKPSHEYSSVWRQRNVPFPTPEDIRADLQQTLLIVDGLILVAAGLMSYLLAGWTLAPIKRMYERQQRFVSDASHELRTPLAILQTDLENALHTADADQSKRLHSSLEEVDRMTRLVNGLLQLSRDGGDVSLSTPEVIDIGRFVQSSVDRWRPLAKQRQVHIDLENAGQHTYILASKEQITRVIDNVLKNAVTYNKPDGNVTVSLTKTGRKVRIVVKDTGIGIAKEDLPHIFTRFFRVDKSRSRASGGNGLGMAIVRESVEAMQGSVAIESTPETGTIITLTLPIHKAS